MKQRIRLTEKGLHRIIRKCVNEAKDVLTADGWMNGSFARDMGYKFLPSSRDLPTSAERPWKKRNWFKDKASQMSSDWDDIDDTYPYGKKRWKGLDRTEAMADKKSQEGLFEPDWYPEDIEATTDDMWRKHDPNWKEKENISLKAISRPLHRKGSLNRAFDESLKRNKNRLTEAKLHKIIKKVLKEDTGNYEYMEHYYAELFHRDGDIVDCEEFDIDDLKGAIKWAKAQAAANPDLVSEVFYVDEHGDMEETGYFYGDWSV